MKTQKGAVDIGTLQFFAGIIIMIAMLITGGIFKTNVSVLVTDQETSTHDILEFNDEHTINHWLGGLIDGEQINVESELKKYVGSADKLSLFNVETKITFTNFLLCAITVYIYCPNTLVISGKVIRNHKAHGDNTLNPITRNKVNLSPRADSPLSKDRIIRVQKKLNSLGYSAGVPDGIIGEKTKNAIKIFQLDKNIKTNELFDQETVNLLFSIND